LLLEQYQRQEALAHCREAVRLRPNFPEAQNNLGNVLRELGRLAEAKACYAETLRLNPDLAITYNNVGQALQEESKLAEALTWCVTAPGMPHHVTQRGNPRQEDVLR